MSLPPAEPRAANRTQSLCAALAHHAAAHPGRNAVVRDDLRLTYGELAESVDACAALLRRSGVTERSVAGVTVGDEVQHLIVSIALLALGTRHITLATHDTPDVRAEVARKVGVTDVVAMRAEHRLEDARIVEIPADPHFGGARAGRGPALAVVPGGIVHFKTSGTTGSMRVVAFEEWQIAAQAARHANYSDGRLLRLASIEHNNSKRHRLYCVAEGGTGVFRTDPAAPVAEFCRRHDVNCLDISAFHANDLVRGRSAGDGRLLDGVMVRTGGSRVSQALRRAIEDTLSRELFVRYATTESGGISMAMPGEHDEPDAVGRPLDGVTVEVVDPDGVPVPRGTVGAIRVRAPGVATEYHGDPDATRARFRDGWFLPGDAASILDDGTVVVHGRCDDMIILNGLNIYPAEIERVLERHPAVRTAAALPVASPVHGQIPVAAVELHDGAAATGAELQTWARDRLALRAPRRIWVMAQLPRNSQGKIAKLEIAAMTRGARP